MKPYRYSISLRVRHPDMDPAKISTTLLLEPTRSWRAGDPRTTAKNTPLEGIWKDTYWTTDVLEGSCPDKSLAAALSDIVTRFNSNKDFFRRIRTEGGRAEFYVGWLIDGNRGDEFENALLGSLAELGVSLSLDIYPPERKDI